jgi:CheY-like chemotaxis protein
VIILVVDDEQAILLMLRDLLQDEGYTVLTALNGAVALALARDVKPDLVLTDLMMPTMDGYELARHLHTEPAMAHIPVIAMSAAHRSFDHVLFTDVIAKPFDIAPLIATISAQLPNAA